MVSRRFSSRRSDDSLRSRERPMRTSFWRESRAAAPRTRRTRASQRIANTTATTTHTVRVALAMLESSAVGSRKTCATPTGRPFGVSRGVHTTTARSERCFPPRRTTISPTVARACPLRIVAMTSGERTTRRPAGVESTCRPRRDHTVSFTSSSADAKARASRCLARRFATTRFPRTSVGESTESE